MVRNALSEVRRIIYDLRPMALDDLGIVPTFKKYLMTIEEYNEGANFTSIHMETSPFIQIMKLLFSISSRMCNQCD